jgi:hypothetical protein
VRNYTGPIKEDKIAGFSGKGRLILTFMAFIHEKKLNTNIALAPKINGAKAIIVINFREIGVI